MSKGLELRGQLMLIGVYDVSEKKRTTGPGLAARTSPCSAAYQLPFELLCSCSKNEVCYHISSNTLTMWGWQWNVQYVGMENKQRSLILLQWNFTRQVNVSAGVVHQKPVTLPINRIHPDTVPRSIHWTPSQWPLSNLSIFIQFLSIVIENCWKKG